MDYIDHVKQQIREYEMNMLAGRMPDRLTDYMWTLLQSHQIGRIDKVTLQKKMMQIKEMTDMNKEIDGAKIPKRRLK